MSFVPLAGLGNLQSLTLHYASAENVPGVSNLTGLTHLDLYQCGISNVNFLSNLTNLTYLDLSWSYVSNVSPLSKLRLLQYLDLSNDPLGDGSSLAALTNLSGSLFLDFVSLKSIEPLRGLTKLAELTLFRNQINDLGPLSNLTNLTVLDLGYNPLDKLSALAGLTNLQRLDVEGALLTNLTDLPLLPKLNSFDANSTRLTDIVPLSSFTNLQSLNLSYNRLTNIASLTNLTRLRTVYLQVNLLDTNSGSDAMNIAQTLENRLIDVRYDPQNAPPYVSIPSTWLVPGKEPSSAFAGLVDDLTPADQLKVEIQCSDTGLVRVALGQNQISMFPARSTGIGVLSRPYVPNEPNNSGLLRYLNVTPVSNKTGTATITITATDDTGLSGSATTALTVSMPASFDAERIGSSNSNLHWRTFGQNPWTVQTNVFHIAPGSAQNGSAESWLEASMIGPGLLTFWWRSATSNWGGEAQFTAVCRDAPLTGHGWIPWSYDYYIYSGGETNDWKKETLSFPPGSWLLRWYSAEISYENSTTIWLADANFLVEPPKCWFETSLASSSLHSFWLDLRGPPGGVYTVEASSDLREWVTLQKVILEDFKMFIFDTNAPPPKRFYRARQSTLSPIWLEQPHLTASSAVELVMHSETGQWLRLECSKDLSNWEILAQMIGSSDTSHFTDADATASSQRFYRAKYAIPIRASPRGPVLPRRSHLPLPFILGVSDQKPF